jgi:DNA-binding GntR family transcriptional regulator
MENYSKGQAPSQPVLLCSFTCFESLMRLVHNSLHEHVAATLREEIFDGTLAPGSFVDEVALCERLEISRTPLREALKVLSAEGLVRHEPRRGCFVNEVTEQDLDEIFPVIALLEGRCAFEAACNASDADLAVLETLHQKLQAHAAAKRIVDYYQTNFAIHEAIITLADNRWLAQVIADLRKILKLARLQQLHAPGRLAQSLSEHLAVFAALKARDSEGAEAAMRTHLTRQREALRELARQQKSRRLV